MAGYIFSVLSHFLGARLLLLIEVKQGRVKDPLLQVSRLKKGVEVSGIGHFGIGT
jgi:hypothetical protein